MSLKALRVLYERACADTLWCFPLAVQKVSSDSAPSSGINLSFLKRISSSLVTQVLKLNWVATAGGQLSSQFVACLHAFWLLGLYGFFFFFSFFSKGKGWQWKLSLERSNRTLLLQLNALRGLINHSMVLDIC